MTGATAGAPRELGLLGLGAIGGILADRLVGAVDRLVVCDAEAGKREQAKALGAEPVATARELGERVEVVVVSLPNPPAVEQALLGEDGLFAGLSDGALVIDMSTVDPDASRRMYAAAAERGIAYLDTPVSGGEPMSGGVDGARNGNLTFMVGGDADAYERARPTMMLIGQHSFHLGPAGAGSTVKLISNLCSGIYALVFAEAFVLGEAAGFDREALIEVFHHTDAKSFFMTDYLYPRFAREDYEPGFSVALQLKDHRLAAALGKELQVPLFLNGIAEQLYTAMAASGSAQYDVVEAVRFLGRLAGAEQAATAT